LLGRGNPEEKKDTSYETSWQFLEEVTRRVLAKMPILKGVRAVRQWTGPCDITPDQQAIVGKTPVDGFLSIADGAVTGSSSRLPWAGSCQ
jgi:sarcosine oxidase subunit beta